MINPENAWSLVRQHALKALLVDVQWKSIVKKASYKLLDVSDDDITILRLDTNTAQKLSKSKVFNAIVLFTALDCKVKRGSLLSPTVAEETALVFFHPQMTWDATGDFIIEDN